MTVQRQIDELIAQRASEWIEVLRTGGPKEREAFVDWLRESRRHVSEFLTMVALDRELDEINLRGFVDRETLLQRVSPQVAELRERQGLHKDTQRPSRTWRRPMALAASVAVIAIALGLVIGIWSAPTNYITGVGEHRAIELADGSVVQLNAQSHMQVRLHDSARDLKLVSGEALFKVAPDPHRPFLVRTQNAIVQAIGTQFNVHARPSGTTVSVIEGKVQVSANPYIGSQTGPAAEYADPKTAGAALAALSAGQEARIGTSGIIQTNPKADVASAIAWRQQRLVFQKTALEDVVRAFNRHNVSPKLRLEGVEPGSHHYSATFDADDPESFADFLMREEDLTVEKRNGEIVIWRR